MCSEADILKAVYETMYYIAKHDHGLTHWQAKIYSVGCVYRSTWKSYERGIH